MRLTGGGKTAFFLADLVPTTAHLPLPWIMGFDLYPLHDAGEQEEMDSASGARRLARHFRA